MIDDVYSASHLLAGTTCDFAYGQGSEVDFFSTAVSLTVVYAVGRALDQAISEAFIRPPEYEHTWLQWESGALFLGFVAGSVLLNRFIYPVKNRKRGFLSCPLERHFPGKEFAAIQSLRIEKVRTARAKKKRA